MQYIQKPEQLEYAASLSVDQEHKVRAYFREKFGPDVEVVESRPAV